MSLHLQNRRQLTSAVKYFIMFLRSINKTGSYMKILKQVYKKLNDEHHPADLNHFDIGTLISCALFFRQAYSGHDYLSKTEEQQLDTDIGSLEKMFIADKKHAAKNQQLVKTLNYKFGYQLK